MGYMDEIRDLIVDMAMAGADVKELEDAILYSASVIKYHSALDAHFMSHESYRRECRNSYEAYDIKELEKKYSTNVHNK